MFCFLQKSTAEWTSSEGDNTMMLFYSLALQMSLGLQQHRVIFMQVKNVEGTDGQVLNVSL